VCGCQPWADLLPYTAWASDGSSATLTINKGNNRTGKAFILFVDESIGVTTPVLVAQGTLA
jgi:hypothetical protein